MVKVGVYNLGRVNCLSLYGDGEICEH